MLSGVSKLCEELHDTTGHITRARIEERFQVSEGDMIEQATVIVHIKRSPAAIVTLHAEEPGEASLAGFFQGLLVGHTHLAQGEQNHGGIVIVGEEIVEELERPASWFALAILHGPIPLAEDLLADQPVRRLRQCRVGRLYTRIRQSDDRDRSIPDRRNTGL